MYSKLVSLIVAVALVAVVAPASGVQARGLCVPSYLPIMDHLIPFLLFASGFVSDTSNRNLREPVPVNCAGVKCIEW
jgi:hypothetical protein